MARVLGKREGRFGEAETALNRALGIQNNSLGTNHPATASTLNNLGVLLEEQGRYEKAQSLLGRALAVREKMLGSDHPETVATLITLAKLYKNIGRNPDAKMLLEQVLVIREHSGRDLDIARTLNDLAAIYFNNKEYSKAEELYEKAVSILAKNGDCNHPVLLIILGNLHQALEALGRKSDYDVIVSRILKG